MGQGLKSWVGGAQCCFLSTLSQLSTEFFRDQTGEGDSPTNKKNGQVCSDLNSTTHNSTGYDTVYPGVASDPKAEH